MSCFILSFANRTCESNLLLKDKSHTKPSAYKRGVFKTDHNQLLKDKDPQGGQTELLFCFPYTPPTDLPNQGKELMAKPQATAIMMVSTELGGTVSTEPQRWVSNSLQEKCPGHSYVRWLQFSLDVFRWNQQAPGASSSTSLIIKSSHSGLLLWKSMLSRQLDLVAFMHRILL